MAMNKEGFSFERTLLENGGITKSAPEGQTAFRWTGRPEAFVFLKTGRLSVHFRTKDRAVPWAECRATSGQDCMPVTAAILSDRDIAVRATCMAPCTWIELSPIRLTLLVHGQTEFRRALFAAHARRLPAFFSRLSSNSGARFEQRLADWLLRRQELGEVCATHVEIAADLLTAREVVSRKLRDFAEKGWITQSRGRILLSAPAALTRLAKDSFTVCSVASRPFQTGHA